MKILYQTTMDRTVVFLCPERVHFIIIIIIIIIIFYLFIKYVQYIFISLTDEENHDRIGSLWNKT